MAMPHVAGTLRLTSLDKVAGGNQPCVSPTNDYGLPGSLLIVMSDLALRLDNGVCVEAGDKAILLGVGITVMGWFGLVFVCGHSGLGGAEPAQCGRFRKQSHTKGQDHKPRGLSLYTPLALEAEAALNEIYSSRAGAYPMV